MTTEKKLYDALQVLLNSWPVIDHLANNDPMALAQARAAVSEYKESIKKVEADGWTLVRSDSKIPVCLGDTLTDFRGHTAPLTGGRPPHKPSSTGRVYVEPGLEFFPSVFGLEWVRGSAQADPPRRWHTRANGQPLDTEE